MMSPPIRAVRLVALLLAANVVLSCLFAALTLLFHADVLAYQLGRDVGADRQELALTLWTRPIPIFVVAVAYIVVVRQLLRGRRRAYTRVRILSALGFAAVGWLLAVGEYPAWLRVVQGGQLVLLAGLIVAVNRPVVRAACTNEPAPERRPHHRGAALLLVVLTPLIAEVSLGTVPLAMAWFMVIYVPVYGAGALLVRELTRRAGGGWPSLLLMGVAYGLLEEGLALQSLTSPHLYGAADWAPRLFGVNTAYTELNLTYHAVFSIAIPIALVELTFRGHGTAPYLRRGGLITCAIVTLLGAALLRISVPPTEDPGYTMPMTAVAVVLVLIAALSIAALRILPRHCATPQPDARSSRPPRPTVVGLCCAVATFGFFALIFPFGSARQSAFTQGNWALVAMAVAAALVTFTAVALQRWHRNPDWTTTHCLTAITAALLAHTAFGILANAETSADTAFLLAVAGTTVALTQQLGRRLPHPPHIRGMSAPAAPGKPDPSPESATAIS